MLEVWLASVHVAGTAVAVGRRAEAEGFDGISFGDTQNIAADPFAGLCLAATGTERLGLMVGVTNPVTRLPAVVASAIATVQVESAGRAVLGLGRGDSSLGHVGRVPASVDVTERFADDVQTYLRADVVDIDGYSSQIPWIGQTGQSKVPLDVAATGPRMLALGARCAERLTVNVGALPDRVAWAIDIARQVARRRHRRRRHSRRRSRSGRTWSWQPTPRFGSPVSWRGARSHRTPTFRACPEVPPPA